MVAIVIGCKNTSGMRNRTVRWSGDIDALAVKLAGESGYFPEKRNGGVSKFLTELIQREAGAIRGEERKVIPTPPPVQAASKIQPKRKTSSG